VVAPDALEAETQRIAEKLAALQPEITRRFKRVLNEIGASSFSRAIELENEAQRALSDEVAAQGWPQGPG
jgi:enoyl-CoA hydratase/carnithine racemase